MTIPVQTITLPTEDYDLDATLASGQVFRWHRQDGSWEGVVLGRWASLRQAREGIVARCVGPGRDRDWLTHFLQTDLDLRKVLATFPDDEPTRRAVAACRGLRLLRQEPWECLASFILSSTKRIVQIQEIVRLLCLRFGEAVPGPVDHEPVFAFPTSARIAASSEVELRACKMGFRAPYLLGTAHAVESGRVNLAEIGQRDMDQARDELLKLPGVGRKIADCVLLFAYGFPQAFPVDVWVMKALRHLYLPRSRRVTLRHLQDFSARHFGPNAGYAQQYLFHYMRTQLPSPALVDAKQAKSASRQRRDYVPNSLP